MGSGGWGCDVGVLGGWGRVGEEGEEAGEGGEGGGGVSVEGGAEGGEELGVFWWVSWVPFFGGEGGFGPSRESPL